MEEWMENEWFNRYIGEWMEEYIVRYEDECLGTDMFGWLYGRMISKDVWMDDLDPCLIQAQFVLSNCCG